MGRAWVCVFSVLVTLLFPTIIANEMTLNYTLREEQDPDTFVGNIARDSLLYNMYTPEDYKRLKYALFTKASKVAGKFKIDEQTSTIWTNETLDREKECEDKVICDLSIDVEVYMTNPDTNFDDLKTIIRVHVFLEDINDNAPTFPQGEVTLTVAESVAVGQVLLTSGAIDKDTGVNNSIQSYELMPANGMFALKVIENPYGSPDLGLEVKYPLDRESRDLYQMVVVAKDGGYPRRSGSVTINVRVSDVNDNRPMFVKENFNVTIPEDSPINTAILTLAANDPDSGKNGKLTYHFSSRTTEEVKKLLAINPETGDLYPIEKLDYESETKYVFIVEVNDQGSPSKSSEATVILIIADVNDNAPQIVINLPPSGMDISENTEFGTFIAHVSVFDADSGENGEVSCYLHDDNFILQKFSDFDYYKILLQKPLDYEKSPTHAVNITCTDKGENPRTNTSYFIVKVKDVNDNAPMFDGERILAHIGENNRYSDLITTLEAYDIDGPGNDLVVYSILEDWDNLVNLDSQSGEIRASKIYDRETMPSFEIVVKAEDASDATLSSTATVVVFVDDKNDRPPRFSIPHFLFYVSERNAKNAVVGKLNATDQDEEQSFSYSFSPTHTNISKYFVIDEYTGFIRNVRKLDREDIKQYDFSVTVRDPVISKFHDTANVTVYIQDWNDNVPTVLFPSEHNNTVYIPYYKSVGSTILIVRAYDNDTDDNAKLTYTIEQGNDKQLFFLNMMSGEMLIAREMLKADSGTYRLVIAAHDNGSPQLTSYANLNIIIMVHNDTISGYLDQGAQQYIAIVITLVCVTAVLCVAVIITICIIKRIDKERRQMKEKKTTQQVYLASNVETMENGTSPNNKPYDNEIEKLKKKIKRELSFSVEDDSVPLDTSEVTGASSSFATFKNMTSYSSIDQKALANPQASSSVLTNNTHTPEQFSMKQALYAEKRRDINKLAAERIRETSHESSASSHWYSETEAKKADDVASELSQGAETDSGRGCSEEDVQSNRGSSAVPHTDNEDLKLYSPRYRSTHHDNGHNVSSQNSTASQLSLHSSSSLPRGTGELPHYPRNISFSDDSVNANTTVDERRKKQQQQRNKDNIQMQTFTQLNASQTPYHLRSANRVHFSDHAPVHGSFVDVTQSTPGLRYSVGDMDGIMFDSAMTIQEEDDRTTTTSGSYTINAEELCNEIDDLFFKDIIV